MKFIENLLKFPKQHFFLKIIDFLASPPSGARTAASKHIIEENKSERNAKRLFRCLHIQHIHNKQHNILHRCRLPRTATDTNWT